MPTSSRRRTLTGAAVLALIVAGVGSYAAIQNGSSPLLPSGSFCKAQAGGEVLSLGTGQARIAATIAGVARHQSMPRHAVTVAYATALQESKLRNLDYGDLDSVGVFQQRPSEGWGTTRQLEDPVYATTKFFAALVSVPSYQRIPVYKAAQAVQRSADGQAYRQYTQLASALTSAFTGSAPRAVWCWFDGADAKIQLAAAARQLTKAFGPVTVRSAADPTMRVSANGSDGWALAAWLVSHAGVYGIREVRYLGYQWTAAHGTQGWVRQDSQHHAPAPPGTVVVG
ncbi:MAG TPA: hypothetical protein VGI64_01910 [Streptosporangiaceae bacterium]